MPEDPRLQDWLGREEAVADVLALGPARALAATLDRDAGWVRAGAPLPPLWHWAYLHTPAPAARLGPDGHPQTDRFLPPVPLPRRMWAGGRLTFHHPLQLGEWARRVSTVARIEEKHGRSGRFFRVTVAHRILAGGGVAVEEEQVLAYREAASPGEREAAAAPGKPQVAALPGEREGAAGEPAAATSPEEPAPDWSDVVRPTPVLLFRFSALTLNGHRIHYDQPYARSEGYPALVVHAPLLALLLLDGAERRLGRGPATFEYRALAPLFEGEAIRIEGRAEEDGAAVWARGEDGRVAMTGRVR